MNPFQKSVYYNEKDFEYEKALSKEYWDINAGFKVLLFRVDYINTQKHALYGESKAHKKSFMPPIQITIIPDFKDSEKEYSAGIGIYHEKVSINFDIHIDELKRKNIQIKEGDFFSYLEGEKNQVFVITSKSEININNNAGGYKPFYERYSAILAQQDQIPKYITDTFVK